MDYFSKILILHKYLQKCVNENKTKETTQTLVQIKNLHGKIIEAIFDVKKSNESNKLEVLSDLERFNFKIINIINECEDQIMQSTQIENSDPLNKNSVSLNKNLDSLVFFHAEWCGHCKSFMPTWDALEKIISKDIINMVKISCVEK